MRPQSFPWYSHFLGSHVEVDFFGHRELVVLTGQAEHGVVGLLGCFAVGG